MKEKYKSEPISKVGFFDFATIQIGAKMFCSRLKLAQKKNSIY